MCNFGCEGTKNCAKYQKNLEFFPKSQLLGIAPLPKTPYLCTRNSEPHVYVSSFTIHKSICLVWYYNGPAAKPARLCVCYFTTMTSDFLTKR